jgi:hypothetical protein
MWFGNAGAVAERVGVRRIKSTSYIPTHPNLLPQGLIYAHIFNAGRKSPLRRERVWVRGK